MKSHTSHAVCTFRALLIPLMILGCLSLAGVASAQPGTWVSNSPEGGIVLALAIDPLTPTTLYAGTEGAGVFRSTDGGGSWNAVNTGLTAKSVQALAIDPLTPTTVYAGTTGGVFRSADGGASWSAVANAFIRALAINPVTPSTLYAGTGGGVLRSTNGGGSWSAINTGLTNTSVHALAIDPLTPTTLYAGTFGGVFRSTDGGASWSAVTNAFIRAFAIDPLTPTTLYAGGTGVFKSVDGGGSWSAVNTGLTNKDVRALAIDLQENGWTGYITLGPLGSNRGAVAASTVSRTLEFAMHRPRSCRGGPESNSARCSRENGRTYTRRITRPFARRCL